MSTQSHSQCQSVLSCLDGGCIFTCVPAHLQQVAAGLLQDKLWLDSTYFPSNLARLKASYDFAVEKLAQLNIKVYPAKVVS